MSITELPPPTIAPLYERMTPEHKEIVVREAWNPQQLFNPGKLFPMPGRCADIKQL